MTTTIAEGIWVPWDQFPGQTGSYTVIFIDKDGSIRQTIATHKGYGCWAAHSEGKYLAWQRS